MCALFVIGLAYIVTFYITQGNYPIEALGSLERHHRLRRDHGRLRDGDPLALSQGFLHAV